MNTLITTRLCSLALSAALALAALRPVPSLAADDTLVSCLLEPSMVVAVASPVSGVVSRIFRERGDAVRLGDRLFELEAAAEQAALAIVSTRLKLAESKLSRHQALIREGILSEQEGDELQAELDLARAARDEARAMLDRRTVLSPINGVVLKRLTAPGEQVAGNPVLRLATLNPLHADVTMRASAYGRLKPGMPLRISAGEGLPILSGRIRQVDPVIDAASGTFSITVELANPGNRIPAGLSCALR